MSKLLRLLILMSQNEYSRVPTSSVEINIEKRMQFRLIA